MSSSIGNSTPNSSQHTSNLPSSVSSGSGGPKEKKKIIVQVDGSIMGKYTKDWSTDTGGHIKSYIPISYTDFSKVPNNFKDDVWNALMGDYELDVPPEVARPLLEPSWSQKFRTYKHTLRQHYLRKNITEVPKGVDPDIWRKFLENENGQKKKEECERNTKNRSKLEFSHCLGRCTYAQKKYMMQEENSEISLSRVDTWLQAHKQKDGKLLESVKETYENVLAAKERNKNKRTFEDFDNDELVEVFGKDKKGRVRAMGSNISRKKLTHLGVAKSKLEQHKKSSQELASFKDEMISLVDSRMDNFEGLMQAILSKITTKSPAVVNSLVSDPGSSSVPRSLHLSQNIDTIFATGGISHSSCPAPPTRNPQVILCDKFGKKLAKGYVVTDATSNMCHFKKVGYGEKKVYVKEVIDPDAPLFDPPQRGNHTFAGLVDGGFLIWLDCWLEYV
ncbi:uncharacterized protein M6B38_102835 [Iris pallida]|uniref:Transposase n=1 Tax=Iris pallida TaxID=29817 RepID=A0AAX6G694_IRIPA|nr:uncharacterized protein M6B38_102835 [Iris pallida]